MRCRAPKVRRPSEKQIGCYSSHTTRPRVEKWRFLDEILVGRTSESCCIVMTRTTVMFQKPGKRWESQYYG